MTDSTDNKVTSDKVTGDKVTIDLAGRTAIVTGAAGGIGAALVERYKAAGARTISWSRRRTGAADLEIEVDIADAAAVARAAEETIRHASRVDILVNNAGILGPVAPVWETDPADYKHVLDVNLAGTFNTCHALIAHMREQAPDPMRGWIVNISSALAKEPTAKTAAYASSKAGQIALTRAIARDVAADQIAVNALTPTVIDAGMSDAYDAARRQFLLDAIPLGRFGTTDELADMVLWMTSNACSFTTGAVFDLSGGKASW
jgi:3-oxoacyl-[acyl-carrier protein] reductase